MINVMMEIWSMEMAVRQVVQFNRILIVLMAHSPPLLNVTKYAVMAMSLMLNVMMGIQMTATAVLQFA